MGNTLIDLSPPSKKEKALFLQDQADTLEGKDPPPPPI